MKQVWEKTEVHTGFWLRDGRARNHLDDLGVDGRTILIRIFKKWDGETWTRLLWLRAGTGGGIL
jgi:hypothetical protein